MAENIYPKLHNATWPGIVGKGPDSEPPISLEKMLEMTAAAEVDGVKFDGVDVGLFDPSINLDDLDGIKRLADQVSKHNLVIGSLVAPIWGGPAMGTKEDRANFVDQVRKSCVYGQKLKEMGIRPYGVVRIDSASSVEDWAKDPVNNTKLIAQTFREACDVAADYGEKLAAEGEICWGGMHSWRAMLNTLEAVDRPNIGFQADMSHTFLYLLGYNSPEDRILPLDYQWNDRETLTEGLKKLTAALRPWTLDFHVAQNDGTAYGSGSHDKTGRHCQATDPNGKLDIAIDAGHWLRNENGELTKAFKHICWDGCMFPNAVLEQQKTWNDILAAMIKVRNLNSWS
ncbi:MAG: xylose isomerase [Sphingobacteriales bacterium 17-39-43]|uniref:sugar phosphate isomerase/epimerase family protein n=1 Tax=Daejeonella sp. TaxID=2805397 RepID=UPI000BCF6B96|nr:TIM barrel protein [Daejeonella sp.]OYZ30602.1 MAG: xylose isomerase [Sphingobacteriales bacterium 16-39-50]OZA23295.1 MAG: xylose isomerase [Sphingobacteriales bacterium 17-39-43]HQT23406.1 TIM barrel protein [Daejeonella sp.]HQT57875.1 TIM barrel protein [Daejeonella sp.]